MIVVGSAQVPLRDWWGEEVRFSSARALAAVGTTLHDAKPAALFGNPALLWTGERVGVEFGGGLRVSAEERTRIVYDGFENAVGEVAFADNYGASGLAGPIAVAGRLGPVAVGAGAAPVRDFRYDYLKEYRDDFYVKIGEDRVAQSGGLYAANLGASWRPIEWLSIGASGSYVLGDRRLESWSIDGDDTTGRVFETGEPSGIGYAAGIAVRPAKRLSVAADLRGPTALDDWRSADSLMPAESRTLPASGGLSVAYRATGSLPSTVTVEGRYQLWSGSDSTYANTLLLRAGVEHVLLTLVRLRYGFGVEPLAANPAVQAVQAGLGLGFDAGVAQVDIGLMHARSVIGPLEFTDPLNEDGVKVYENRTAIAVSFSRGF
jgi:hypothetical protein